MLIGITGATSGIGLAIKKLPHQFIEFNREDGDIHNCELVYSKLHQCDVFFNNAWDGDCQEKLLKYFFAEWKDKSKKIICPFYKKQIGNPLIIPKRHFEKLVNLNSDKGAKHYLPKNDFVYIPSSFGTIFDVGSFFKNIF